jgi:hypothetical protein
MISSKKLCPLDQEAGLAVYLGKVLEVMSTSVYTGLNPLNFIRKHFLQICVRKVAEQVLEVMSAGQKRGV